MNIKFFGLTLTLLLAINLPANAADEGRAETALKLETPAEPAAINHWKASETSLFTDMSGARAANKDAYTFGDVHLVNQGLALEYVVQPQFKVVGRTQYLENYYELKTKAGEFTQKNNGLGDSYLGVSGVLLNQYAFRLSADAGASLPTGSINESNEYSTTHYSYRMQMGSGTYDGVLGLTAAYNLNPVMIGVSETATLRTGINPNGYHLGNAYRSDAWVDYSLGYGLTPRIVGYYRDRGAIHGSDYTLSRNAGTEFYYHDYMDWRVSAALKYDYPVSKLIGLNAEIGIPFEQNAINYDNVNIATRYYGSLSLAGQF